MHGIKSSFKQCNPSIINTVSFVIETGSELKLLEAENRRLKMENDFLKKLEEIERR